MHRLLQPQRLPSEGPEQLQYLIDRFAITDVFSRFFLSVDLKEWSAAATCITDPFTMGVPVNRWGDPTLDGKPVARAEWIAALEERNAGWFQTLHVHPNELVAIEGDRAWLGSYQIVPHSVGLQDGDTYTSWGFYDVDLVRAADGWKIEKIMIGARLVNNVNIEAINKRVRERAAEMRAK